MIQVKDGRNVVRSLKARKKRYERRYEMTSEKMQETVAANPERETAEIAKWMQAYCVLRWMGIK